MDSVRFCFRRRTGTVLVLFLLFALQSLAAPHHSTASLPGGYYSVWMGPRPYGGFADPLSASVDSLGNIYVADTQNHRIKKLSPSGQVLEVWGSRGSEPGRFEFPSGVAASADGRVFVADSGNNRVQIFDATGTVLGQWTSAGASPMFFPTGMAIDSLGAVYVSDTMNHRILKFSSTGQLITIIGGLGIGNGQFSSPYGLAVDDAHLYVADKNNRRIQKFTLGGAYVTQWGWMELSTGTFPRYGSPSGIAVAGPDLILVSDRGGMQNPPLSGPTRHLERSTKSGSSPVQWGETGDGAGQYQSPGAIVARPGGGTYVVDSGNNRIQLLDPAWQSTEIWSGAGSAPGELSAPSSAKAGSGGLIYVADTGNNRIQVFNADRTYLRHFGGSGITSTPADIAIAANGDVWVADSGAASRVARFSAEGAFLGAIGAGQVNAPQGVAIDADGDIWVADTGGARLREFSQQGTVLRTIQTFTGSTAGLSSPVDVEVDAAGRLWVVDRDAARVFVLEPTGALVTSFGGFGESAGQFRLPMGLAISPAGHVYVSDSANDRVQRFSSAGIWESTIASAGAGPGQVRRPMRPTVLPDGMLLVPERDNHRLHLFAHDAAPPVTTASGIPGMLTNRDVTITLSAEDAGSGVATTFYRIGSGSVMVYTQPFTIDYDFEGFVRFWSIDRVGNTEAVNSSRVRIDKTPPTGTFVLNGGEQFATTSTVVASSTITGANEVRFDTGFGFGQWGPLWPSQSLLLPGEGVREVHAQYRDAAGNILSLSETITVDWTPPATTAHGIPEGPVARSVSISLTATDAVSGVASTFYRVGDAAFAPYLPGQAITIDAQGETLLKWYSIDRAGNTEATASATVKIIPPAKVPAEITRIDGPNRYQTALAVSRKMFSQATTVVISTGESFSDALAASSLAGALNAPVILTLPSRLSTGTVEEIKRLDAKHVFVIGGKGAVHDTVLDELKATGLSVTRIGGRDRFATAAQVSAKTIAIRGNVAYPEAVFIVRGDDFADAVSASSAAWASRIPILLVMPSAIPSATSEAITSQGFSRAIVVGGPGAVSDGVAGKIRTLGLNTVTRVGGPDRYVTSAEFAKWAHRESILGFEDVGLATGARFPDALSGGAGMGSRGGTLLLTSPETLPEAVRGTLEIFSADIKRIAVFGGKSAVEESVVDSVSATLR